MSAPWRATTRAPLIRGSPPPSRDLGATLEKLGIKLFSRERTPDQHVAWAVQTGLIEFLGSSAPATAEEISSHTCLTECGADSLAGILSALGLLECQQASRYILTPAAREFLLRGSPYFIGDQLEPPRFEIPRAYVRGRRQWLTGLQLSLMSRRPVFRFGTMDRLVNQHARNLGACVSAVRTGEFDGIECLVDVAGGSGVFAIPFALEYPGARVILAELPAAIPNIMRILHDHQLDHRIEVIGMNALSFPWRLPPCDAIFLGNFLHGFGEETCRQICRESRLSLRPGGRTWIHEMVWNDTRDGPLTTALWHAAMRSVGPGRQRTIAEITRVLADSGFTRMRSTPTSGAYSLISGSRTC